MQYHASAGAILYIVLKKELPGICGVQNAFLNKDFQSIQADFPRLESEMCISGLGSMDFDGAFTPDPGFCQAITDCSQCNRILSIPVRHNKTFRELTVFFCQKEILALEQVGELSYILHTGCDPDTLAAQFLKLPERTAFLCSCTVDSSLIQQKNMLEMVCSGCDPDVAQLAVDAACGTAGYAQILQIDGHTANEMQTILYNEKGILLVNVVYTQDQEQMQLQPIDISWVTNYIQNCAKHSGG